MKRGLVPDKIYRFTWEYGDDLVGFFCRALPEGWLMIHRFDGELSLDGFCIFHESVISSSSELDSSDIHTRVQVDRGAVGDGLSGSEDKISAVLNRLSAGVRIMGIYNKDGGYSELDVGLPCEIGRDFIDYHSVSPKAEVETSKSRILFDDILMLSLDGRYERALFSAIRAD